METPDTTGNPGPAVVYVNIELDLEAVPDVSFVIVDMQGRVVKRWNEAVQPQYKKQVYLNNLPAGKYILQVQAGSDRFTRNFNVIQ